MVKYFVVGLSALIRKPVSANIGPTKSNTSAPTKKATRRRKILYHIAALHKKFRAVEVRKDETVNRRITSMFNALLPNGALQERSLNVACFLNSYGPNFIDWIYDAIDLDDRGHRLVYL